MDLAVTSGAIATLREEATRAHPLECCGLLLGRGRLIERALPCANVHPDPARHFEIDPAALIAAHRAARGGGPQVLGYYHSHPAGQAAPSPTDQASASGDGRVWAIVAGDEIGWWRDLPQGFAAQSVEFVASVSSVSR
ncbi:MAG: M67 family metallopeptidase [Sphingomonadaceae bacterium]|nr:M67 family metallopeptidase [Sphingomonadaceae bacterium]